MHAPFTASRPGPGGRSGAICGSVMDLAPPDSGRATCSSRPAAAAATTVEAPLWRVINPSGLATATATSAPPTAIVTARFILTPEGAMPLADPAMTPHFILVFTFHVSRFTFHVSDNLHLHRFDQVARV